VESQLRDDATITHIKRGGYILSEPSDSPVALIIATGSEVALAMSAQKKLAAKGLSVRVVSMPCTEVFLEQDLAYQEHVLPPKLTARVATEAGSTDYWYRFVGLNGRVVGLDRFGVSAPADQAYTYLGLTADAVAEAVQAVIGSIAA
jgi:transketolase